MKTKSVIYDILSTNNIGFDESERDFRELLDFIREKTMSERHSCKIRIDVGYYFFTPRGKLGLSRRPQIHIVVEGKDTFNLEKLLEFKLLELNDYNIYEKYTFAEKIFNKHNLNLFSFYSIENAIIEVKGDTDKTKLTLCSSHAQSSPNILGEEE